MPYEYRTPQAEEDADRYMMLGSGSLQKRRDDHGSHGIYQGFFVGEKGGFEKHALLGFLVSVFRSTNSKWLLSEFGI